MRRLFGLLLGAVACAASAPAPAQDGPALRDRAREVLLSELDSDPRLADAAGVLARARLHVVDNPDQPIVIVDNGAVGRGAILVAPAKGARARLKPGLYAFDFGEGRSSVTLDGRPVELAPARLTSAGGRDPAIFRLFDIDWMCGDWPDDGGPGLNFCETFVACASYDLFC